MTAIANPVRVNRVAPATSAPRALSLAAAAAVIGPLAYVVVTLFHPAGVHGNDHPAVFREYAMSEAWIAIHLAQLAAMIVGLSGIAGLALSMLHFQEKGRLLALLAAASAVVSIPTAAVLQAVDGIALKRAVDAWVAAGGTVDSAPFAAAETMRWLEHGSNAVFGFTLGMAVILAGAAMAMTREALYPRLMGWTGTAIGVAAVISAVVVAANGFSHAAQAWGLARNPVLWVWTMVAGVLMWRRMRDVDARLTTPPGFGRAPEEGPR